MKSSQTYDAREQSLKMILVILMSYTIFADMSSFVIENALY